MRYRTLSPTGDYAFGGIGQFLVNSSEAVAQAIYTRLMLWTGEWFLDTDEGTPYTQQVLGYGTQDTRDIAIKQRVLDTPGVDQILSYASSVDAQRRMKVSMTVQTLYGTTQVTANLGVTQ
jgi:hypothetical protein